MRLFLSYARVDRRYCEQIAELLNSFDVWYDSRMLAGQHWWTEIVRQLKTCDGFIYILSPDSVESEYCRKEHEIARRLGKPVIPVLIEADTVLPESLQQYHYADFSQGITVEAVKSLLNAVFRIDEHAMHRGGGGAENGASRNVDVDPLSSSDQLEEMASDPLFSPDALMDAEFAFSEIPEAPQPVDPGPVSLPEPVPTAQLHAQDLLAPTLVEDPGDVEQPGASMDVDLMVAEAAEAFYAGEYDRAVFLLKQAQSRGYSAGFVDLEGMLQEAEHALEEQARLQDAVREYQPIASLVQAELTRVHGCRAFHLFQNEYPGYDPEGLAAICGQESAAEDEWCSVPAGRVKMRRHEKVKVFYLAEFEISKYPVTNAEMLEFIEAPDGYVNQSWWDFSPHARSWRRWYSEPTQPKPGQSNHPFANVSWYEALAYCRWLSYRTQTTISLPTEPQWQRSAQGDDGRRFPWGNVFNKAYCNTSEGGNGMTVPVTQYPLGMSPYGVFDLVGNVWEWCINGEFGGDDRSISEHEKRVIKGGSFIRNYRQVQCQRYFSLDPQVRHETIGFRVVRLRD